MTTEVGVMPLSLTLLPIEWTRHAGGIGGPIAYSVEGLPANEEAVISMRPSGWRVAGMPWSMFDQNAGCILLLQDVA